MKRPLNWSSVSTLLLCGLIGATIGGAAMWFTVRGAGREPTVPAPDPLQTPASAYEWSEQPSPRFPIPPYARFLEGVSIVLDPGHGGRADRKNWKRGPTGLREAEVNLRVAQYLRDFLSATGAKVVMTRDADAYLDKNMASDLRKRSAIANDLKADLFLSLHHNGVDNSPANYTSVFYHGTPDHSPASLDAARWLLAGINDVLRLEQHLECGLVSDFAVVPKRGFAVLRETNVPAVLVEASFFTNPDEEERLRDQVYNRREAYGLFLGLARWAQAGLPRVEIARTSTQKSRRREEIVVVLDDGLAGRRGFGLKLPQIQSESIVVELSGEPITFSFDASKKRLAISNIPISVRRRGGRLRVDFVNTSGQHVLHPWIEIPPE